MRAYVRGAALFALALAATACGRARAPAGTTDGTTGTGPSAALLTCTRCHGDAAAGNSAPPRSAKGATATTDVGVGAHQAHLRDGALRRAIACAECHVVPATAEAPGHIGKERAAVEFGPLARTGPSAPVWDATSQTCASTYCHGGTLGSGSNSTPKWTVVNGTQSACGTCHAVPPPAPHPTVTGGLSACAGCHPGTMGADGTIDVAGGRHIDGKRDLGGMGCAVCHGDAGRAPPELAAAPPRDTHGSTTSAAVGAHLAHLQPGALSGGVACAECHVVPASGDHANGAADVAFGALARAVLPGDARAVTPSFDAGTLSCASTYCHGNFKNGNAANAPVWNAGPAAASCTSCHGSPPGGSHPASADCGSCHPGYGPSAVDASTHVDGRVQVVTLTCSSCHGDSARASVAGADPAQQAAPPRDAHGDATAPGVGAHLAHVNHAPATALSSPIGCPTCHGPTPASTTHSDGAVAIAFGGLAVSGGAAPTWSATTLGCAATYCHGNFRGGNGAGTTPVWTAAGPLGCTSCHGAPPPASAGHPQNPACGTCHTGYGASSVNPATHVDGKVDVVAATCTSCHGTPGRAGADPYVAAAPPAGTRGETATSARAVGAHLAHLQGGPLRAAVACTECHAIPAQPLHESGTAELTFGTLARSGGASPAWDGNTRSCASTYCHGATLAAGGTLQAPAWTTVDGTQAACGTCHGVPPPTSTGHRAVAGTGTARCATCHPATVQADGTIDVAGGKHIDGALQVTGQTCTSCHGDPARAPAAIAPAPPAGTHGETATTSRAVGAHQAHLAGGNVRAPIGCAECHVVPASTSGHPTGAVSVAFGPLASAGGGAAPTWNGSSCASTYCHGAKLGAGGSATQPVWTTVDGSQRQCGSCHGAPPPTSSGHPPSGADVASCAGCHPATVKPDGTIDLAGGKHLDGTLQVTAASCTSCHGDATRAPAAIAPAPPRDTHGNTTSDAVGAHLRHLTGGSIRAALACSDCHAVPSDAAHATQPLDLTWGALARTGGLTPSWTAGTLTCTNYCHGISLAGGSDTTPTWNGGSAQAACGTCHALPPPAASGHPRVTGSGTATCSACHPATVTSTGVIDTAGGRHVNGAVETANLTCTSCHGDTARTAVSGADAQVKAAPPFGTRGESATSARAVGAHLAHLNKGSGAIASPTACAECHAVPTSTSHDDGTAQVAFGTKARTGNVSPAWNAGNLTCTSVYCHGNFTGGATAAAPSWTGGAMTCTSCHAAPPQSGEHRKHQRSYNGQPITCADCHGTGFSSTGVTGTAVPLHVNGVKNVGGAGSRINTWTRTGTGGTCAPACHGTERW